MEKKPMNTELICTGDVSTAKKMLSASSVPKVLPIYMTSVFSFDDVPSLDAVYTGEPGVYMYSRMFHPNSDNAAEIVAASEAAEDAVVFSSGMAAITTTVLAHVRQGDHIVASHVLYGGVYDFFMNELPRFGVETTLVDFDDEEAVERAVRPNTVIFYAETIFNPTMGVTNIPHAAEMAHRHGCKLIIDNSFATGCVARPLELGADISVYSATKYLGGHSDFFGGAAISDKETITRLRRYISLYGNVMSPMDAWLLCRSMRTLELRMEQHSRNGLAVAAFLEKNPHVEKVNYPGLPSSPFKALTERIFVNGRCGGMLSADIVNGEAGAGAFIKACSHIKLVPSLAGVSTTISYPVKTSHRAYTPEALAEAGISPGQLRFSIGLENADDIIEELDRALKSI